MIGRSTKLFLEVLTTLIVLTAIAGAVLAWRLSQGPISLGFIAPTVESVINSGLSGTKVDFEDVVVAWREARRTLDVRAVGVNVLRPDGSRIAQLPEVSASLSGRALLHGMIAPTRLEVLGAKIVLVRAPDGGFGLTSGETEPGDNSSALTLLLDELLHPPDPDRSMGYLQQLSVTETEIILIDQATGRIWRAPRADVILSRDAAGLRADATLVIDLAGELARVTATGLYAAQDQYIDITARTSSFQPATLSAIDPNLAMLAALHVPISGETRVRLDRDGRLQTLDFDISGTAGKLSEPAHFPEDVPIRSLRIRGSAAAGLDRIDVAEAMLDLNGPTIEMSGAAVDLNSKPHISVEGVVRKLPTDELKRLWPLYTSPNARQWITTNLSGGTVEETRFEATLVAQDSTFAAVDAERIAVQLRFAGVDVNYLSPMPRVRNVSGTGTMDASRLDLAITGGGIGELRVSEGTIAITGLDAKDQDAAIEVVVRGPVRDVLQLVDSQPLGYVSKIGLSPADFGGNSATRLRLGLPLISALKFEQVQLAAAANVANFTQRSAVLGQDITDGALVVRVDQRGMEITGTVTAANTKADVRMTRSFLANATVVARTNVKATTDSAARRAFGLDYVPYVEGPVGLDLKMTEQRGKRSDLVLDLALADATLDVPELEWRKEPGTPGTAQLRMTLINERLAEISSARISAGDLSAQGRLSFAEDGKTLRRVDIERLKAGLTDASGSYVRGPDGISIDVSGNSINAAPLLRDKSPSQPNRPPLKVSATLARVYFAPDRYIERAKIDARRSTERWESFDVQAVVGGDGAAHNMGVSLRSEGGVQRLNGSAEDAGALLKAVGVTPNVVGGRLELSGATDLAAEGRPLSGKLRIRDFRVVNAPLLARVLSVALLTGIADSLRGEGIGFSILESDFAFHDPKLEIKESRASGASIGITAGGVIDTNAETVDLSGTIVPAYAVNSLLGRIPLVGDILVGGKGGGIFAANYKVEGPIDDAKVSINPLSTLAPGFLRNLFGAGSSSPTGTEPRPELPSGPPAQSQ